MKTLATMPPNSRHQHRQSKTQRCGKHTPIQPPRRSAEALLAPHAKVLEQLPRDAQLATGHAALVLEPHKVRLDRREGHERLVLRVAHLRAAAERLSARAPRTAGGGDPDNLPGRSPPPPPASFTPY